MGILYAIGNALARQALVTMKKKKVHRGGVSHRQMKRFINPSPRKSFFSIGNKKINIGGKKKWS